MTQHRLLIGTYTRRAAQGIYWGHFDDVLGTFECTSLAAETPSPSFIARNANTVYAVNELEEGGVCAFIVSGDELKPRFRAPSRGAHPCHLCATDRWIAVANYTSGSVATYDPELRPVDFVQHEGSGPNDARQKSAHAHQACVTPEGALLVPDLGSDRLFRYDVRDGVLSPDAVITEIEPGSGPRHVAFHPKLDVVYLINELDNTIDVFDRVPSPLRRVQRVSTLPEGFAARSYTAEIQVSSDGRRLYASNRGHDSIATFRVDPDGRLTLLGHVPTLGRHPRHFCLDPGEQWLLVANQDDDNVVVYRLEDGVPTESTCNAPAPVPVCLLFV